MNKFLVTLFAVLAYAGVANAQVDLVSAAQKAQDGIDSAVAAKADAEKSAQEMSEEAKAEIDAIKLQLQEKIAEMEVEKATRDEKKAQEMRENAKDEVEAIKLQLQDKIVEIETQRAAKAAAEAE